MPPQDWKSPCSTDRQPILFLPWEVLTLGLLVWCDKPQAHVFRQQLWPQKFPKIVGKPLLNLFWRRVGSWVSPGGHWKYQPQTVQIQSLGIPTSSFPPSCMVHSTPMTCKIWWNADIYTCCSNCTLCNFEICSFKLYITLPFKPQPDPTQKGNLKGLLEFLKIQIRHTVAWPVGLFAFLSDFCNK